MFVGPRSYCRRIAIQEGGQENLLLGESNNPYAMFNKLKEL